jgi:predicted enzyme related to lactoylglutathione lyase
MPARKKAAKKSAAKAKKPARKKAVARKKVAPRKALPKRAAPKKVAPRQAAPQAPSAPPSAIGLVLHHMDYTTHNLSEVKRFYVELLGFKRFEHDLKMNYLYVQTGSSSSLGFMPPMPGMGEPSPAKEPTLYLIVSNVDKAYADLSAKGVQFEGPPADMPWGHRVVRTTDPEGRPVLLATAKTNS